MACVESYTSPAPNQLLDSPSVAYRAFVKDESSWDLLALVIGAGAVATLYQGRHRVLTGRWAILTSVGVALAFVIAAAIVLLSA